MVDFGGFVNESDANSGMQRGCLAAQVTGAILNLVVNLVDRGVSNGNSNVRLRIQIGKRIVVKSPIKCSTQFPRLIFH